MLIRWATSKHCRLTLPGATVICPTPAPLLAPAGSEAGLQRLTEATSNFGRVSGAGCDCAMPKAKIRLRPMSFMAQARAIWAPNILPVFSRDFTSRLCPESHTERHRVRNAVTGLRRAPHDSPSLHLQSIFRLLEAQRW